MRQPGRGGQEDLGGRFTGLNGTSASPTWMLARTASSGEDHKNFGLRGKQKEQEGKDMEETSRTSGTRVMEPGG